MPREHDEFGTLLRTIGGALYRRVLRVTCDEAAATQAARALFVRLLVHGRASLADERARWAWIYRAGTNRGLQLLAATARPGGEAPGAPAVGPLPAMAALRAFDEATQNTVVLTALDGLTIEEVAEVLGLPSANLGRKLDEWRRDERKKTGAAASARTGETHPSMFALERDRPMHAEHIAGCAVCRAALEEAAHAGEAFARGVDDAVVQRLFEQVTAERKALRGGVRWKRILIMSGALVGVTIMAFAVTKPRDRKPGDLPFKGGTASRAKAAGLQISVRRGTDVGAFVPGATSRLGDRLHFRVRVSGPRFFGLRVRGPGGAKTQLFPAEGDKAVPVTPGQALDRDYIIEAPLAAPGRTLYLEGYFAEHEFVLDGRPDPGIELVPVRLDIEP